MKAERFSDEGWQVSRGAVGIDSIEMAGGWLTENMSSPGRLRELQAEFDAPGVVRKIRRIFWADPEFWASWICRSGLREVVANIVGPDPALIFHAAFLKPAQLGSAVGFHQDQALWEAELPGGVSFWMPLDPAGRDNGGIIVCPRSQQAGLIEHSDLPGHAWHPVVDPAAEGLAQVQVTADPGDIVIWQRYLVHGSGGNSSGKARRAMVLVFVPDGDHVRKQAVDRVRMAEIEGLATGTGFERPSR